MEKDMEMGLWYTVTIITIKGSFRMIKNMDMEYNIFIMAILMKENGTKIKNMAMANIHQNKIIINMKVIFMKINAMVKEPMNLKMDTNTLENFKMIKFMEMVKLQKDLKKLFLVSLEIITTYLCELSYYKIFNY